ncbi:MAG: acyl-CoA dehydrogenase [Rhodospirillaceae bacterium]|nr:acyl-CoA dehydrogenase [Rhodospirillaceae bacterium]
MDFNDTPAEAEFRAEARDWLASQAPKREPGQSYEVRRGDDALVPHAKEWQAKKFEAGFAGINLPKEYGGRGATRIEQIIFGQEEATFVTPPTIFGISHGMVVPTLLAYATEEQKQKFVPATLKGDEVWCQLFSEPGGGSDLAGLRTRSERDGDEWTINGQKIWTSGAHYADRGVLVTRSDAGVEKHKGLTYFFLDMKSPGIDIRPIKQISGASNFNEVFFADVRIPDSQRLGKEGEGWRVALTTLMNERVETGVRPAPDFDDIFALARNLPIEDGPAIADEAIREQLADWYIQTQGVKLTRLRTMTALSRGQQPGPENSIAKVVTSSKRQRIAHFGMDLMDMGGMMRNRDATPMQALFQDAMLDSPGNRIAAGTDEILRNVIGERVLGLPREIRVDKDKPFSDLAALEK